MSAVSYGGINPGEVARQSQQLWQSVRGECWQQQHRDVFCLAQLMFVQTCTNT